MNPSVAIDEKPQKLPRDDERPQQKLHSALKTNVKSLKQGLRSVMNGNRHGKPTGPSLKEKADRDKPIPEDADSTETDELNLEDVETVPHVVDNKKEDSMNDNDQLRNSFHNQEGPQRLVWQDSPRAPQELMGTSNTASNTTSKPSRNVPRRVGSDPNLHRSEETLSDLAAPSMDGGLLDSQSAPQHPLTPGVSPCGRNTPTSKNSKFLRGKIKISALKNFVGAGIDLGSSSNYHVGKSHQNAHEDDAVDHSRRRQDDPEDEFASPQPMVMGPGRKIANKMRSSILGFKNLAKTNRNAAVLLDDDTASGSLNDLNGARDYEPKDVFDTADSDATPSDPTRATSPLLSAQENAMEQGASSTTTETLAQEKDEAKQRRREKHHKRRKQMEGGGGDSNHALGQGSESAQSSSGPPHQRKNTKGKLDASARERLKKHSEGRDFRNRTTTANRRRRHSLASKTSERHLDASDGMSDLPDLVPAIPSKHATRPSLARVDGQHSSSRKLVEAQSGRKHNKEESDRHRGRPRSRQSLIAAQGTKSDPTLGPERELSISVLDLQDKKDEDDDRSVGGDIHESSSTILEDSGDSVEDALEKDRSSKSTGCMADSSAQHDTTAGLNASSPRRPGEGSLQHIESYRSDDYLQLIIRNVPAKASSPSPSEDEEEIGATAGSVPIYRTGSPRRDRRLSRRASRKGLTDEAPDLRRSTEPPFRRKGSGRVQRERREPSSRRKPRSDKSTRTRDRSLHRRKSETSAQRRTRKGLTRSDASHESEPVLSAALGTENAGGSLAESGAEHGGNAEASTRTPLDGSASVTEGSAKTYEGNEVAESIVDLDESAKGNADGNGPAPALPDVSAEVSVAPSEVSADHLKESSRRHGHDGKESRRRHHKHKVTKDKRADRKSSKAHTPSKHGNSTSTSKQPKQHRSSVRGRADGALKKAPSFRGRSEKPRRDSRSSIERRERRHSTDARKRPSLGSECDIRSMKPEVPSAPNTESGSNSGLSKIKW